VTILPVAPVSALCGDGRQHIATNEIGCVLVLHTGLIRGAMNDTKHRIGMLL